jgi:hypothetical protein
MQEISKNRDKQMTKLSVLWSGVFNNELAGIIPDILFNPLIF